MKRITSFEELKALREDILAQQKQDLQGKVIVNVSLATCGIAAGGMATQEALKDEVSQQGLENVVFQQSGCMTYCHSEPTVEVTLPGGTPVVFGHVDDAKARQIVQHYIMAGELVDGVIAPNYERVTL
jgi:NADP-reducing hydrogenase subunit HndB